MSEGGDRPLKNRRALVTGAAHGLGLTLAGALAKAGCSLDLTDRDAKALRKAAAGIRESFGVEVETHPMNLMERLTPEVLALECEDADFAVITPLAAPEGSLADLDEENWKSVWERTVMVPVNLIREIMETMEERGEGVIVAVLDPPDPATEAEHIAGCAAHGALSAFIGAEGRACAEAGVKLLELDGGNANGLPGRLVAFLSEPMKQNRSMPDGAVLSPDGIWSQVIRRAPPDREKRPALFLDRDGVLAIEAHYLHTVEDAHLDPGAGAVIAQANRLGLPVVLVTNQAGIGYGYFGWDDFMAVQEKLLGDLAAGGARIDGVFACPHHAKGKPPYNHPDHPARKPNPGMLSMAGEELNLDLARSWIVGDRESDLAAGKNAGLAGGLQVLTGHGARQGEREAALALADNTFKVFTGESIAEALRLLPLFKGN
ncbi:MAG TPA: HAD-IIIA family hydrolase [Rhodospirillales bacterium]|nr:HAD-IIIA family hydrolase [Rhodospirillales bacterium]